MLIGIIGEDPYDTNAIKNLLLQKYEGKANFKPLLKRITGSQVISRKTKILLEKELKSNSYDLIICTIDLDDLETNIQKIADINNKIKKLTLSKLINILLLNIFELESLILADINTFNDIFNTKITFKSDPMYKENPKDFLKEKTLKSKKRFSESDNPEIFKQLNIEQVRKNCRYFAKFINELDNKFNA